MSVNESPVRMPETSKSLHEMFISVFRRVNSFVTHRPETRMVTPPTRTLTSKRTVLSVLSTSAKRKETSGTRTIATPVRGERAVTISLMKRCTLLVVMRRKLCY